jgi:hypothetical protein
VAVTACAEIIECLQLDGPFTYAISFRKQCFHTYRIPQVEHTPRVPFEFTGLVFGLERGTIHNHWRKCKDQHNETKHAGRPPALSWQEFDEIIAEILRGFGQQRPLTLPEIVSIVQNKILNSLLPDTLCHVLTQDPRLKSCRGHTIDERRMTISDEKIWGYFATFFFIVSGARAYFVFNVDEMGNQGWAEAQEMVYFVPADCGEPFVDYPFPRTGKRITVIACIAAGGNVIRPCLVVTRKAFHNELSVHGFTPEKTGIYS